MSKRELRLALVTTTAMLAMASAAAPARAQAGDAAPGGQAAGGADIVVTGSNIRRTNADTATPVVTVTEDDIQDQGAINIAEVINKLPQSGSPYYSDTSSTSDVYSAGINSVDLRGLGSLRTLTLVNGRRFVSGIATANSVDTSAIPTDLIERLEVTTGGASAVYGSDAVAGVVNFVLKKDFEGLQLRAQAGITEEGDGAKYKLSATWGTQFAGGRGHLTLFASGDRTEPIKRVDREYSDHLVRLADSTKPGEVTTGVSLYPNTSPYGVFFPSVGTSSTATRRVVLPDGTVSAFDAARDSLDTQQFGNLRTGGRRYIGGLLGSYDLSDRTSLFFEVNTAYYEASSELAPQIFTTSTTGSNAINGNGVGGGIAVTIPKNNPFIPAAILSLVPASRTDFGWSRFFQNELGLRTYDYARTMFRVVGGAEGEIDVVPSQRPWRWTAYVEYGQTDIDQTLAGNLRTDRLYQSLRVESNGAGGYRCVDVVARASGCVPLNLFTGKKLTDAEIAWIGTQAKMKGQARQIVGSASVSGDLLSLPAGPLSFAAGGEWRREENSNISDEALQRGLVTTLQKRPIMGEIEVKEAFAEVSVPLLKDLPLIERLEAEAAYRIADYSTAGTVGAWKVGGSWTPVGGIRFRSVLARSVRAPAISDLHGLGSVGVVSIVDPCRNGGSPPDAPPAFATARKANCLATPGITAAFNPATTSLGFINAGNTDLTAEKARTWTLGAVLTPGFVPSLLVSVDYFKIDIDDAITTLAGQTAADQCANTGLDVFCSLITRDPTNGLIQTVSGRPVNAASERMEGIDFSLSYRLPIDAIGLPGALRFDANHSWLLEYQTQPFAGVAFDDTIKGEPAYPAHKTNLRLMYTKGPLNVTVSERIIGRTYRIVGLDFAGNAVPAYWYTGVVVRYNLTKQAQVYAGVDNLTDEQPPFFPAPYIGSITSTNTAAGVYDIAGRFFYGGVRLRF